MRWISLKDALALIGGDSRREELRLAGAAGDVSARLRRENATSFSMDCELWLLTDLIDWVGSSILWPAHPYNPRGPYNPAFRQYEGTTYHPVAIEIDRLSLFETFGEPVESSAPARPGRKPSGRTQGPEIVEKFLRDAAEGNVSLARGGLRRAAKELHRRYLGYTLKYIEDLIRPDYQRLKSRNRKA